MRGTRGLIIAVACGALVLSGCGDDDPSTADDVADASTCAELLDAYDADAVTDAEAQLIAARLVELAEADFAEDGVLDEKTTCNQVIFELDPEHSDAFEGIDLEEMGTEVDQADNGEPMPANPS
jgi:hypothetical protein